MNGNKGKKESGKVSNGHMNDEEMKIKSRVEQTNASLSMDAKLNVNKDGRTANPGRPILGFEKFPVTMNLPKNLKRRFDILMIKNDVTTRWKMLELMIDDWDVHHNNQSSLD